MAEINRIRTHSITYSADGEKWTPLIVEKILHTMIQDGVSNDAVLNFNGKNQTVTAEWNEYIRAEIPAE